jgi:hypothetical protein
MYVYIHLFQGIIQRRDFVNTLETSMFHKSEELMVQLFNGNSIQGGNAGTHRATEGAGTRYALQICVA